MSLKTPPLLTPTTIATILPTKKILLQTCQMVMKTEDSLIFSWEGRHIPFSFIFVLLVLFWTFFSWMFTFIFSIDFLSFTFVLVIYLYVHDLHSKFAAVSCSHFDAFRQFHLIHKNASMAQLFCFMQYLCKCHKAEVFGCDESL